MALSKIKLSSDVEKLPESWYSAVEKSKQKAGKFLKKLAAVDQSTSVVVGRFCAVDIDRLWQLKYPYCKISMDNAVRFTPQGKVQAKIGDMGVFFVNKPQAILTMEELAKKYPQIHQEVQIKLKAGQWF